MRFVGFSQFKACISDDYCKRSWRALKIFRILDVIIHHSLIIVFQESINQILCPEAQI